MKPDDVLVSHPTWGSVWLSNVSYFTDGDGRPYVTGDAWDTSECGSPYLPDDYPGQIERLTFPTSCIRKVRSHA